MEILFEIIYNNNATKERNKPVLPINNIEIIITIKAHQINSVVIFDFE